MLSFDYKELLVKFRYPIAILLIGLVLVGGGLFIFKSGILSSATKVEVLGTNDNAIPDLHQSRQDNMITAEIAGEVINPGVYKLISGSRVNDLLIVSEGFSVKADRVWTDKYLNRAAKLTDGQKVYIPGTNSQSNTSTANKTVGDQTISMANLSDSSKLININTASASELDKLPGIGPVYGQNIIEHRPYSTVEELVSKGVLKQSLYNKVKELVTIY